ncbi:Os04g0539500, partial [Oryza sativa Japonica Group]
RRNAASALGPRRGLSRGHRLSRTPRHPRPQPPPPRAPRRLRSRRSRRSSSLSGTRSAARRTSRTITFCRRGKKSKHGKNGKNKPKKRGRKPKQLPPHPSGAAASAPAPGDRRCSHCGVQKTPQWRAGPEGAKTLCNACGVRYKSGRLLPEYRPACSPTFVSAIHSNSHRKVLEMRRKKEVGSGLLTAAAAAAPAVASF